MTSTEPVIEVQFPLNQFNIGDTLKFKERDWRVADIRNRIGMILVPTIPTRTETFWTVGELLPIKGFWFRVAIVGREGFVLHPKQPVRDRDVEQ